jgi:hypothetical protein
MRSREDLHKMGLVLLKNAFEPLDEEKLRGIEYDEIVQKPFDSERLAQQVREIIDRRKTPLSFPEEALIEEAPAAGVLPLFKEEEFVPAPSSARPGDEVEEKIRNMLRDETLSMERELEKRLKASLRAEFKEWQDREKK